MTKLKCNHLQSGHTMFTKSKKEAKRCVKELRKEPHQVKLRIRRTNHVIRGKGWLIEAR